MITTVSKSAADVLAMVVKSGSKGGKQASSPPAPSTSTGVTKRISDAWNKPTTNIVEGFLTYDHGSGKNYSTAKSHPEHKGYLRWNDCHHGPAWTSLGFSTNRGPVYHRRLDLQPLSDLYGPPPEFEARDFYSGLPANNLLGPESIRFQENMPFHTREFVCKLINVDFDLLPIAFSMFTRYWKYEYVTPNNVDYWEVTHLVYGFKSGPFKTPKYYEHFPLVYDPAHYQRLDGKSTYVLDQSLDSPGLPDGIVFSPTRGHRANPIPRNIFENLSVEAKANWRDDPDALATQGPDTPVEGFLYEQRPGGQLVLSAPKSILKTVTMHGAGKIPGVLTDADGRALWNRSMGIIDTSITRPGITWKAADVEELSDQERPEETKSTPKKPAPEKPATKKGGAKQTPTKKSPAKKTPTKKPAAKSAGVKKTPAKKAAVKKSTPPKSAGKKAAPVQRTNTRTTRSSTKR
ncbi:hypothetical protein KVT40_000664 [Elsinoe batatas]|uniref:Uncharacterized protein n=1 Tax=Elsinoe batatas TaxID=2601811 RepID=A0A8K0LAI1_9PEZI|nr:hypothetical protein KVT40_000664 [Elsinoe batatas]